MPTNNKIEKREKQPSGRVGPEEAWGKCRQLYLEEARHLLPGWLQEDKEGGWGAEEASVRNQEQV